MNKPEETVRNFYDTYGWVKKAGGSGEDVLFRRFSPAYYPYHERVNERTLALFDGLDGSLLMAGGGDLPETHVAIARRFSQTTCLDISTLAVEIARQKLDGSGEFIVGSLLEIPKPDNSFDAAYCAHVIYHIDKDEQERAVRELIRVTIPGGRVAVIYANPDSLPRRLAVAKERLPGARRFKRQQPAANAEAGQPPPLYFFVHPLAWWTQFNDSCKVDIKPWDVMGKPAEEALLVTDRIASVAYRLCAWIERRYPERAVRWWEYPLITLTKKVRGVRAG